jgi:dihydropteroate synthase
VAPLSQRYARGALVGVLNVTPDSFSDGGEHAGLEDAVGLEPVEPITHPRPALGLH